jgi:peptide/nickel transport system permease protein
MHLVATALLTSVFLFVMLNLMRGNAIDIYFGAEKLRTPQAEARLKAELGLDKPLHVQYLLWLGKAVRGNLGVSWRFQEPVMQMFAKRILLTFELWSIAALISTVGSVTLGIYLAVHQNSIADQVVRFVGLVALSAPIYWVAIIIIVLLARIAHWIPPVIYQSFSQNPVQHLQIIAIPSMLWGVTSIPSFSRYVRNSMIDFSAQTTCAQRARKDYMNGRCSCAMLCATPPGLS